MITEIESQLFWIRQYHLQDHKQMQNNEVITKKVNINQSLPIVIRFSDGDITTYMKGDELDEKNDL